MRRARNARDCRSRSSFNLWRAASSLVDESSFVLSSRACVLADTARTRPPTAASPSLSSDAGHCAAAGETPPSTARAVVLACTGAAVTDVLGTVACAAGVALHAGEGSGVVEGGGESAAGVVASSGGADAAASALASRASTAASSTA